LGHRVEDPEIWRGVRAVAGHPLPAQGVIGEIGVDQRVPEPLLTQHPVLAQVLRQQARRQHAHAVVHPACRPEFAHAGVDDGNAGPAVLPAVKRMRIRLSPTEGVERRIEVFLRRLREVVEQVVGELAPSQLAQVGLDVGRVIPCGGVRPQPRGYLRR